LPDDAAALLNFRRRRPHDALRERRRRQTAAGFRTDFGQSETIQNCLPFF